MPPEVTPTPVGAPTDTNTIPEMAFLQSAGEDIADLRSDLESMLARREPTQQAPVQQEVRPLQADDRLPIREDGTLIEPQKATDKPVTGPAAPDAATTKPQQTAQEKALDPYAPEGAKPAEDGEVEPGEVVLDAEGKVRDAKTGRYVPHHAMHQERVRRKELETELAKKNEDWARANERLAVLQEIVHGQQEQTKKAAEQPAAQQPEVEIDPEVDIFGWAKQQKARADAAERRIAEMAEQSQKQYGELNTQQRYRQDVTSFAGKQEDFFQAYTYVANMRTKELKALGFTDEKQIASQLQAEERALVQGELAKGGSPSARLYALAQAKGYVKEAPPAPAAVTPPVTQPAPAAPAPTQAAPQVPQIPQPNPQSVEQVQRIQQGVNASASLSGAGGTAGEGLTIQQIVDLPQEKFDELVGKIGRKRFDQMLGGS